MFKKLTKLIKESEYPMQKMLENPELKEMFYGKMLISFHNI